MVAGSNPAVPNFCKKIEKLLERLLHLLLTFLTKGGEKMYLKEEKPWDFLNKNTPGMFDSLTEQIQKFGLRVFIILLVLLIFIIFIKKYRK